MKPGLVTSWVEVSIKSFDSFFIMHGITLLMVIFGTKLFPDIWLKTSCFPIKLFSILMCVVARMIRRNLRRICTHI